MTMQIEHADHAALAKLLPHGEAMALFDRVITCDEQMLVAGSRQHQQDSFMFAAAGLVDSAMLVEYGAQAAALHAAFNAGDFADPAQAVIGVVRNLQLHREAFSQSSAELIVSATREFVGAGGAMYRFSAELDGALLAEGQLGLMHR